MSYVRTGLGAASKDPAKAWYAWVDQNKSWLGLLAQLEKVATIFISGGTLTPVQDILDQAALYKAGKGGDLGATFRVKAARLSEGLAIQAVVLQVVALVLDASGVVTGGAGTIVGLVLQVAPPACSILSRLLGNLALGKDISSDLLSLGTLMGPVASALQIPGVPQASTAGVQQVVAQVKQTDALRREIFKRLPKDKPAPKTSAGGGSSGKTPSGGGSSGKTPSDTKKAPKSSTAALLLAVGAGVAAVAGAPVAVPIAAGAGALFLALKK